MAKPLNRIIGKWIAQAVALISSLALAPAAMGQGLPDPTRPPAAMMGWKEGVQQSVPPGPVLQSVLVSPDRKVAIISGQAISLGEKFGDARVIKISESEVILSGSDGVQTLKLFPGIEKSATFDRNVPQSERRRQ